MYSCKVRYESLVRALIVGLFLDKPTRPELSGDHYNNLKQHITLYDFIPFGNIVNEPYLRDLMDFNRVPNGSLSE